jgi:hypothetical protein
MSKVMELLNSADWSRKRPSVFYQMVGGVWMLPITVTEALSVHCGAYITHATDVPAQSFEQGLDGFVNGRRLILRLHIRSHKRRNR